MKTIESSPIPAELQECILFQNNVLQKDEEEALDHSLIAELSSEQIRQMTREELVRVILAARLEFLDLDSREQVSCFDRAILERLTYLARYCCQNQISRTFKSRKQCHARFNTK